MNAEELIEASRMSAERTTDGAHARIDLHEAVCAERYKSIDKGLNEVKAMLLAQGSDIHARLNVMSSRQWLAVTATLGAAVVGLAVLAFYLLTRSHS